MLKKISEFFSLLADNLADVFINATMALGCIIDILSPFYFIFLGIIGESIGYLLFGVFGLIVLILMIIANSRK